ncbi:site-specific integrase [Bradyrhizobium viridifuturi]|uniref:site-specific integrase n=1 Tax=Bradyrhizobium viridifuturi TaxID=1654716 RepID=UPI00067F575E|nr:site-specific integrase [Bradyrhizobium viridifuturi]
MTFEEIRRLLTTHFSEMLARQKLKIATSGRLTQLDKSALENGRAFAADALQDGTSLFPGDNDDDLVNRFMERYELNLQSGSDAHKTLRTELKRAYRDYCSSVLAYDRLFESYQFENETDRAPSADRAVGLPYISLQQLIDRHTKDSNLGSQWTSKTQHEKGDHFALLVELLTADRDVTKVSIADAHRVKETLTKYPKNRRKDPRTRDLALLDALNVPDVSTINVQTINKYLQTYGTMFGWAKRNGLVSNNVFEGLHIRLGKKQSRIARTGFSDVQVQTILSELLNNTSGLVQLDYQKWGPLIALYSGARLNEIAQIHLTDIRQQDGVWCFDLNDDDDTKKLKTDASRRLVPMHSQLIELGLLDHVQKLRTENAKKLFPGFQYDAKNGWGRSLGRWFNDRFLVKIGLKAQGVSFHVFRHTVVTRLLQAGIEQPLVQTIVGHEREGVTQRNYFTTGYTLLQRRDAIERLRFDHVVLPAPPECHRETECKAADRLSSTGASTHRREQ